jgi:transcriptional regulator
VYVPPSFALSDDDAWGVVQAAGAGFLVVASATGLIDVFVPVVVSEDRATVTAHVARANSWWRAIGEGCEVLGLFNAANAYVSPSNYVSRSSNPNVVPTWNYVSAEVRGTVRVRDEAAWLADQVATVTDRFERSRPTPWLLSETPEEYVERLLGAIVGLEIEVSGIVGAAKLSQNRPVEDHDEVASSLARGSASEQALAQWMTGRG